MAEAAGSSLPALLLFVGYAALTWGWYEDRVVWLAEWNAMAATEQPALKKNGEGGGASFCLLVLIPAGFKYLQGNQEWGAALTLLCVVVCVYLAAVVLRSITRRITKRRRVDAWPGVFVALTFPRLRANCRNTLLCPGHFDTRLISVP